VQVGFVTGDGGDAIQMLELSAGLIRRGWPVQVIVPELPATELFAQRCADRSVPVTRSPWVRSGILGAQQSLSGLVRLFAGHRGAILHLHTGDVCPPRRALMAIGLLRPRHVFATIHCPYDTLTARSIRAAIWAASVRFSFRAIICPSRNGRDAQLRYGVPEPRVRVIHNCVDVDQFSGGDPEAPLKALGLAPGTRLVVFSSRIEPQKRPLDALEAFVRVHADFPAAHMVFVGSGSLEAEARARAERSGARSRIHFAGYQRNIHDWLAAAAVWIMPSESENFSIALLEALAAGCPIVSTLCQGNDEVLVDCRNALVTPVGDVAAQARALASLLADAGLRSRLSTGARATGQAYGSDRMVEEYHQCYERALAG
jgi:glycosyltransferase involved in cell wall biosynthesis